MAPCPLLLEEGQGCELSGTPLFQGTHNCVAHLGIVRREMDGKIGVAWYDISQPRLVVLNFELWEF